jgi:phenylacetyl-CoA:acceptor oxidoreductase 26-kDa subunit
MSYGSSPWLQRHWDVRAALNFALGGTGAGVLVVLLFSDTSEAHQRVALVVALALIAAGLASVWLEIGRPWRAVHVLFNPFTSWMSRESFAAALVLVFGVPAVVFPRPEYVFAPALAALAFVYCQGRILQNAKGIPAWREPMVTPLIVATALAEGAGVMIVVALLTGEPGSAALAWCAFAVIARAWAWSVYRRRIASAGRPCLAVLDRAGNVLVGLGTLAPLALLVGAALLSDAAGVADLLAGIATLAAGWVFKIALVTRAAFNQGFALPELPARGRG